MQYDYSLEKSTTHPSPLPDLYSLLSFISYILVLICYVCSFFFFLLTDSPTLPTLSADKSPTPLPSIRSPLALWKLGEKIDTHHNYPDESTAINSLVNAFDPLRDKALYVMKEEHWLVSRPKPQKKKVTQEKKGISIRSLSNELVQQKIEKVWGLPRLQNP